MKRSLNFYVRKSHRYLGVSIGAQFLMWTVDGFYFSWMNIKEIRGEDLIKPRTEILSETRTFILPGDSAGQIEGRLGNVQISKIQIAEILAKPYYEIETLDRKGMVRIVLLDAASGALRENITKEEAMQIARNALIQGSELTAIELLTEDEVGAHHEYREKPLPAWAVTFRDPKEFVVYISAESGRVESVRTLNWRIFDFLWMLHTMDYKGRDDFNNYVLRAFSVLGLTTSGSGFLLFAISSPYVRKRIKLRRKRSDL